MVQLSVVFTASLWLFSATQLNAQYQPGSVEKYGGGATFDAEQYKIDRMRIKSLQTEFNYNQGEPLVRDFPKPKKEINSQGEIWIEGYCRYRPAEAYTKSRYNSEMSEKEFITASYPDDTIIYLDYFKGTGNIDWCSNSAKEAEKLECEDIMKSITEESEGGITYRQYKLLFDVSHLANTFEFSRGVFYTIKRVEGAANENIEFRSYYGFTNGCDKTTLTINDNGTYSVGAFFENGDPQGKKIKSGKSKYWKAGEWNEVGFIKDEYNTVRIIINGMEECRYQTPDIPIATRFYRLNFEMPNEYQKKGVKYLIRSIRLEEYPKSN